MTQHNNDALKYLIKTPLYKECNFFCPQWNSLFALHMQLSSNLDVYMDIEDNSNVEYFEEYIENPSSETLIYNFLDSNFFYDFEKLMSIAPSQEYSPIVNFKGKNSEELNNPTLLYGHPRDEKITKNFSYH